MATEPKKKSMPQKTTGTAEVPEAGNVDKIRDILFGQQSRDIEKKIITVNDRLSKESDHLREELSKRMDSLEHFIKNELAALSDRLRTEQAERRSAFKDMSQELKNMLSSLESKIAQTDDHASEKNKELREQILEQSKMLAADSKAQHAATMEILDRHVDELRNDKADSAALADLFSEISVRLKDNFKLPTD